MIEIRVECMNDTKAYLGHSEASMIFNPSMTNIPHHVGRFLKNPSLKNSHPEISARHAHSGELLSPHPENSYPENSHLEYSHLFE